MRNKVFKSLGQQSAPFCIQVSSCLTKQVLDWMYYACDSCALTCYYFIIPLQRKPCIPIHSFVKTLFSHRSTSYFTTTPLHFTIPFVTFKFRSEPKVLVLSHQPSSQVAYCWHQTSWAYSVEYHVSTTLSWSHLLLFGFASTHQIPSSWTVSSVIFMCCMLYFIQKMTCYFDNCIFTRIATVTWF